MFEEILERYWRETLKAEKMKVYEYYINPYDMSEEGKQNALLKYNCMIKNNVKILKLKDLQNLGINVK